MIPRPSSTARAALLALAFAAGGARAAAPAARARVAAPPSALEAVQAAAARARAAGEDVFPLRFASPELADNVQGNAPEARALVRLPPGADRCRPGGEACWLVLFLPGFDAAPEGAMAALAPRLAALERAGAPPSVLVVVDGRTRLGGGFYVDSPASGRFEAMLLDRLLPALRAGLGLGLPAARTLVTGHSMGGFGALWLALRRPGEFAGAAAFNPAARVVPLARGLLAAVEQARGEGGVDPAAMVRAPDPGRFRERLLWAVCAAFLPAPSRPGGVALPFDPARRPWTFAPEAAAGLARFDLSRPLAGAPARAARALPRIAVSGGRLDRLVPPADVEAVAAALSAARGPGREVRLRLREDGDHGSRLGEDFADALRYLTGAE